MPILHRYGLSQPNYFPVNDFEDLNGNPFFPSVEIMNDDFTSTVKHHFWVPILLGLLVLIFEELYFKI